MQLFLVVHEALKYVVPVVSYHDVPVAAAGSAAAVVRGGKMLGAMITDDGSPGVDATVKVATARSSNEPLRRAVHKRRELPALDTALLIRTSPIVGNHVQKQAWCVRRI